MNFSSFLASWLAEIPSASTPYALAAIGLIVCERAGTLNLTAEGLMLVGALAGIAVTLSFGEYWPVALLAGAAAASLAAVPFALLTVFLRSNQVIVGLATVFLYQGATSAIGFSADLQNRAVHGIPKAVFGLALPFDPVALAVIPLTLIVYAVLFGSITGLKLRAVGESPEVADVSGVNVGAYRFTAIIGGSALIGLAGAYISLGIVKVWSPGLTQGRGWIAVALLVFSRWQPWRAVAGAVLFGSIEALLPRLAAAGIHVPQYLMLTAPYLATLVVMILMRDADGGSPSALGRPFIREERR